ncbi:endoplasmic reticulum resident protein 29 [Macrobrachium rosenbergii]|uniref:endoplasmic reticulum resident protein 29 n=1 Tax=Macrobrachium rosenbergii TaxID=79674 RepID=UPI0034D3DFAB
MTWCLGNYMLVCMVLSLFAQLSDAINAKGCTPLDSWTFDKIIPKFKAAIVKFDIAYPYGKKHDEYTRLSAAGRGSPELLVAEVGVKDYGDNENMDLAERFGVVKDDFPVVKLFVAGKEDPIDFDGEFNEENLKMFIRRHSEIYIGLEGCLEVFDRIADKFMVSENVKERKELLREAEDEWDKIKSPSDRPIAETYVKVMRRVLEKGNEFISTETSRVNGLMAEKLTKEKKDEMQGKLNILKSFARDEL